MAKRKRPRPPTMLLWDRNMQRRMTDAVERLNALVNERQGDLAVLRVQVDRLEKVGPRPRKSAAQVAEQQRGE